MAQSPNSGAVRALQLELKNIQGEPVEGFRVQLVNECNLFEWEVAIFGPPGTLYEGGYFKVRIHQTVVSVMYYWWQQFVSISRGCRHAGHIFLHDMDSDMGWQCQSLCVVLCLCLHSTGCPHWPFWSLWFTFITGKYGQASILEHIHMTNCLFLCSAPYLMVFVTFVYSSFDSWHVPSCHPWHNDSSADHEYRPFIRMRMGGYLFKNFVYHSILYKLLPSSLGQVDFPFSCPLNGRLHYGILCQMLVHIFLWPLSPGDISAKFAHAGLIAGCDINL